MKNFKSLTTLTLLKKAIKLSKKWRYLASSLVGLKLGSTCRFSLLNPYLLLQESMCSIGERTNLAAFTLTSVILQF